MLFEVIYVFCCFPMRMDGEEEEEGGGEEKWHYLVNQPDWAWLGWAVTIYKLDTRHSSVTNVY